MVVIDVPQLPTVEQIVEKLRYHAALLQSQSEASQDGIVVFDEEGQIVSFNRRFGEMWGLPASMVGDLTPPGTGPRRSAPSPASPARRGEWGAVEAPERLTEALLAQVSDAE